ncbi:MAG: hypothetical protein J7604_03495 [Sporocytophaga sp.]|uniref:hypothetical protein n=1 Tax=Sporocytophaga sp. TaxID=2231183 RepID=UPI001B0C174C|nr:hypothetical protein [Sporocytophaga sp.]MBO9699245.1 hypothetical protein [Sporocytophaga sp.]
MNFNKPYSHEPQDPRKDPYDLREYDEVIVLLKAGTPDPLFTGHLKLDKNRNKHFLRGRVVELSRFNSTAIILLPEKNIKAHKEAKKVDDRQKLLLTVNYSQIDYILLSFDSFDWKK